MTMSEQAAENVLDSNVVLRAWASGLRSWSRSARDASRAERCRSHELITRAGSPGHRSSAPLLPGPSLLASPVALPSLGDVSIAELVAVLVDVHHRDPLTARLALRLATLAAGYPADTREVSAADALEILDWALQHPV